MAGEHHDDLVVQSLLLDEIGQSVIGMDDELRITYWKVAGSHVVLLREGDQRFHEFLFIPWNPPEEQMI